MGYDSIEEIQKQTHEWAFIKELPETIGVFKKKITDYIEGQVLFICRYEAPELRASVDLTYSAETFDYILVRTMGLNSFRDVRLIYKERDVFEEKTKKYLPLVISNMEHPEQVNLGELYEAKKVEDWEFGKTLPKKSGPLSFTSIPATPLNISTVPLFLSTILTLHAGINSSSCITDCVMSFLVSSR